MRGSHWWEVISPHKGPATQKMFPFDDFIFIWVSPEPISAKKMGITEHRECCNGINPSETISFANSIHHYWSNVLKFCTEHGSITAVSLCKISKRQMWKRLCVNDIGHVLQIFGENGPNRTVSDCKLYLIKHSSHQNSFLENAMARNSGMHFIIIN